VTHLDGPSLAGKSLATGAVVDAIEVPLVSRNQDVGSFRLERRQGDLFGRADREFMMTVATSLALSLTNAHAHRSLEQMAMKDGLTDLFNRRAFDQLLGQEIKAAERYQSPLCLLLGDVDHFKAVNDRFGHPVGDALLKEVATLLTESLREVDIVARYGGEEFAIILPRTDVASGSVLANRIRERIERHVFIIERFTICLTLSLGVAGFSPPSVRTREDMIHAVDQALYQAKSGGRNRVEIQGLPAPAELPIRA
jgi:diguanylate cyclase (GGDEF)-like protein